MILVIQGGGNSEAEISRITSQAMQKALKDLGLKYEVCEADEFLYQNLNCQKYQCALIALHGKGGEDGVVQGLCEYAGLPYTGSGVLASALCFHKYQTKLIMRQLGLPVVEGFLLERLKNFSFKEYELLSSFEGKSRKSDSLSSQLERKNEDRVLLSDVEHLTCPKEFPVVIKPNQEGSSIGVYLSKTQEEYYKNLKKIFQDFDSVLVEKQILGDDVAVGILNGEALEPILIRPKEGFYDYKNKYTPGKTDYFIPAPLEDKILLKLKNYTQCLYEKLDLKSYARVDFMVDSEENIYALEVNTLPGMTPTSLLPKAAQMAGYEFKDIIQLLIDDAI